MITNNMDKFFSRLILALIVFAGVASAASVTNPGVPFSGPGGENCGVRCNGPNQCNAFDTCQTCSGTCK